MVGDPDDPECGFISNYTEAPSPYSTLKLTNVFNTLSNVRARDEREQTGMR